MTCMFCFGSRPTQICLLVRYLEPKNHAYRVNLTHALYCSSFFSPIQTWELPKVTCAHLLQKLANVEACQSCLTRPRQPARGTTTELRKITPNKVNEQKKDLVLGSKCQRKEQTRL